MTVERFLREREPDWEALAALLSRAGDNPERLDPASLRRLGSLYRAAAADLAFARRSFPGDPLTTRLERLVLRGRQAVYADERRRLSAIWFLTTGYWRRVLERPVPLAVAVALLLVPMVLSGVWAIDDPAAAIGVVPEQFRGAVEPGGGPNGLDSGEHAALSSEIFTNNIRVAFLAVASGLLLGLGTMAVTLYNGGFIGAIAGLAIEGGDGGEFFRLVVPHGVLELSCIAVSASAGLRLGWALVEPGALTRGEALRREARPALEIVIGTIPWIVVAGLVEGFVTGSLGLGPAIVVGVGLGVVYVTLLAWRGTSRAARPRPG